MFTLGLIGILQACFLPGWLLSYAFPLRLGSRFLMSFPLSLIVNHYLVFGLAALGIYNPTMMNFILSLELLLLVTLAIRGSGQALKNFSPADLFRERASVLLPLLGLAALHVLGKTFSYWLHGFGGGFREWDAVVSWNAWATIWGQGRIPQETFEYPQLLPITYSITYQFLRNFELQMFAKAIAGMFPLAGILSLIASGFLWPRIS